MSDTPRTDAEVITATCHVQADFARQLERENAALRKAKQMADHERDSVVEELIALRGQLAASRAAHAVSDRTCDQYYDEAEGLKEELATARQEERERALKKGAIPYFSSFGQGAMLTFVNGHYSLTVPTGDKWAELTHRKCLGVGMSPSEAIANADRIRREGGGE